VERSSSSHSRVAKKLSAMALSYASPVDPIEGITPASSAQAMEIVRTKDSGTLQMDIYLNDDESECMVIERYRDSAALIEHAENLGDLFEAILATVSVVHAEILGEVSAELRAKLADGPVQLFTPYQSM
jgi:quinol monooxygenase YgiN